VRRAHCEVHRNALRKSSVGTEDEAAAGAVCVCGACEEDEKVVSRGSSVIRRKSSLLFNTSPTILDELKDALLDARDAEAALADVPPAPMISICPQHSIMISDGLSSAVAEELLKKYGRNELEDKSDPKWLIVSSRVCCPCHVLIERNVAVV